MSNNKPGISKQHKVSFSRPEEGSDDALVHPSQSPDYREQVRLGLPRIRGLCKDHNFSRPYAIYLCQLSEQLDLPLRSVVDAFKSSGLTSLETLEKDAAGYAKVVKRLEQSSDQAHRRKTRVSQARTLSDAAKGASMAAYFSQAQDSRTAYAQE